MWAVKVASVLWATLYHCTHVAVEKVVWQCWHIIRNKSLLICRSVNLQMTLLPPPMRYEVMRSVRFVCRSFCLSVCLSVCRITTKVISHFLKTWCYNWAYQSDESLAVIQLRNGFQITFHFPHHCRIAHSRRFRHSISHTVAARFSQYVPKWLTPTR